MFLLSNMFASLRYRRKHPYQNFCFVSLQYRCHYCTEACAAPGGVYTTGPELLLNVSTLQRHVLYREVSTSQQGPELHRHKSTIQRLLLDVSIYTTGAGAASGLVLSGSW
jgi:hypothetical protein